MKRHGQHNIISAKDHHESCAPLEVLVLPILPLEASCDTVVEPAYKRGQFTSGKHEKSLAGCSFPRVDVGLGLFFILKTLSRNAKVKV